MPPALSAPSSSAASSPGNATAVSYVQSATAHSITPQAALVFTIMLAALVSVVCGVALFRILRQCLAFKRQLAKKKGERSIRPLVLRSGSSTVGLVAGSQGPKPLLLPTMSTVRSSRGKASLASKFLGKWGATHVQQVNSSDVESAPSPTLVDSDFEEKLKGHLTPNWTPRQLYGFPAAHDAPSRVSIIPVTVTESKPLAAMISEDLLARKLGCIPEDEFSVDIVEVSPSTSGSAFGSLVGAPVDPASAVPAIVVHDCSRPVSAVLPFDDAGDRLSPTWLAYLDDGEIEDHLAPHEGS